MNRKLFLVYFITLLCDTLGLEHKRAHDLQPRHHKRSQSSGFHHARASSQQCSYLCPVPPPSPGNHNPGSESSLIFIKETKVYALLNSTRQIAIVLQIGEPIALITNGETGESIFINIDKQTVVHYPTGSNKNLWKESQTTLLDYLLKLGPLTNVNNWKNGQPSKLNPVTEKVKHVIISNIQHLDIAIAVRVKINPDAVVSLISVLINSLLKSSDVVQLLLTNLQSSITVISGDLSKVVNLVVGLKAIDKLLNGGLPSIIQNGTNVSVLLGEDSGLSSLLDLLTQVANQVDLTKILGNLLQRPEEILGLAVQLDRGRYMGIAGITAVINNIQLYAAKRTSPEALVDVLIQVEVDKGIVKITKETLDNVLNRLLSLAQSQTSQFNTGSSWSPLSELLQDIKNEKLVIEGINVSAIINNLITTSGDVSLSDLVKNLLELKPVLDLTKIIATLYSRLVWFLVSGQGLVHIDLLLPHISITLNLSSVTSILKQILSGVNVLKIVSHLLRLDVVGALSQLPTLGAIMKTLDEVITSLLTTVEVPVASALNAVGSILDSLKDLILFGLGRGGKAPPSTGIAGLSILGGGMPVGINTTWISPEEWSKLNGGSTAPTESNSESSEISGLFLNSPNEGQKLTNASGWSLFR